MLLSLQENGETLLAQVEIASACSHAAPPVP
jgi:hypothetical protein